jgi:hypothetical protein
VNGVTCIFAYGGLPVRCGSTCSDDLVWLEEFAAPAFDVAHAGPAACEIGLTADDARFEAARGAGPDPGGGRVPWFSFDSRAADYPLWRAPESRAAVYDEEIEVFYLLDSDATRVEILARAGTRAPRIALLRVLRELATAHARHRGALHLHASAFCYRGAAIVVAGPKRAGKTSLLLHALGDPAVRYLANDRVILSVRPTAPPMARGMPTVVTLRPDAAGLFPRHQLRRANAYRAYFTRAEARARVATGDATEGMQLSLSPAQFCDLAGTMAVGEAPLAALVFPRVDELATGVAVRGIDASVAAHRLWSSVLPVCDSLLVRALLPEPSGAECDEACAATVASSAPALECVLGRAGYADPCARLSLLNRLVASPGRSGHPGPVPA